MQDAEGLVERINQALDDGDYESALLLASNAVRVHPSDPELHLARGDALAESGDLQDALLAYREAVRLAPRVPETWSAVARTHFMLAEFDAAREAAQHACEQGASADACDLLCRLEEREGRLAQADEMARKANDLAPEAYPLPLRMSESDFRATVSKALDEIPETFRAALNGELVLLVEPVPAMELLRQSGPSIAPDLLGLYIGVPLPERTSASDAADLPDRIYLFQRNLEHEVSTHEQLVEEIAITLYHELGHYFGFTDEQLDERDYG